MKKDDWEDIEVNEKKTAKVYFESNLIQSVYDKIDFLREESQEILGEIDSTEFKQHLNEFDLEEFSEDTIAQIDDILDNISQFKDGMIDPEYIPNDVRKHYRNTQAYFNRDADYLRRAKSKMQRLKAEKLTDSYRTNCRIIELCDKAIAVRPEKFDAYVLKAEALTNIKCYDESIDAYVTALSLKDDVDVWLAIADANRLNRKLEDALDVYDSILERYDKSYEVFKGKARVYFDMDNYAECNAMFRKANDIEYLDEESFKIWSECLMQLQND
jgi:tetratricopeptide (TPR) repeat protein